MNNKDIIRLNNRIHELAAENHYFRQVLVDDLWALAMALGETCIAGDTRVYLQQAEDSTKRALTHTEGK